jgi:hypothetical protein
MHIPISFSESKYRPVGWSFGYCEHCQQEGVLRLESVRQDLEVWFVPVAELPKGWVPRCDFCRRVVRSFPNPVAVSFNEWSHGDGLLALAAKLGIAPPAPQPEPSPDVRLRSLLSAAEKATSHSHIDHGAVGPATGAIAGALAAIPLGMVLYEKQIVQPGLDELGFVGMLMFFSALPGALIGLTVGHIIRSYRKVVVRIAECYRNYGIDLHRLVLLSQEYSRRIRKAVRAVAAEAAVGAVKPLHPQSFADR